MESLNSSPDVGICPMIAPASAAEAGGTPAAAAVDDGRPAVAVAAATTAAAATPAMAATTGGGGSTAARTAAAAADAAATAAATCRGGDDGGGDDDNDDDDDDEGVDPGLCLIPTAGVGIQANGDTVYATEEALYVATTDYQNDVVVAASTAAAAVVAGDGRGSGLVEEATAAAGVAFPPSTFVTHLHQFDLTTPSATYVGSGAVAGSLLNQFSMHAHNGSLFVATTDGAPWDADRNPSSSRVSAVQADSDGGMAVVGAVTDLGVGERIFAVRYVADRAYVVTFERTDPLYVIDLADPTAPRRVGELKLPGFASYLHPIGPGRLLGVGQDATAEGVPTAAKVTLFSVEDPAAPVELDSWVDAPAVLGGGADGDGDAAVPTPRPGTSSSAVAWDHRAFLYWPPTATAVLPLSGYGTRRFTGSLVLTVGADALTEVGRVAHPDGTAVARNWVLGGDHLWSLSQSTMMVHALDGLAQEGLIEIAAGNDAGRVPRAEEGDEAPTEDPDWTEEPTTDVDNGKEAFPTDPDGGALGGDEAAPEGTPTPTDTEGVAFMAQTMDGGEEVGAPVADAYAADVALTPPPVWR